MRFDCPTTLKPHNPIDFPMHRFFLTDIVLELKKPVNLSPLARQLARVLRLQPGAQIEVLDGEGRAFAVELLDVSPRTAQGLVLSVRAMSSEPSLDLTHYQCSLKADKFEWVLQKGTELGVSRFVPVISQRSVVRPAATLLKKYDRWRTIIREAAEQSGRGRLPVLAEPLEFAGALGSHDSVRLLPYEVAIGGSTGSLGEIVQKEDATTSRISLMIGPEGGFEAAEIEVAQAVGWHIVSLGPRILRAETAALAAITVVMEGMGELR